MSNESHNLKRALADAQRQLKVAREEESNWRNRVKWWEKEIATITNDLRRIEHRDALRIYNDQKGIPNP